MLNQIILVGRLVSTKMQETDEDNIKAIITLAVPRSFKNSEGIYETDFIPCVLFESVAKNTSEWCQKGDVIGIRGRIQINDNNIQIIGEKVTFLSSKKVENENN